MNFEAKHRRDLDLLATGGYGLVVLNLWTVVKTFIYYLCAPDLVYELLFAWYGDDFLKQSLRITILVVALLNFIIQFYVGIKASKVGKGTRKSSVPFVIFSVVLCLISLLYITEDICFIADTPALAILTLLVDLFVLFVQVEIAVCAIKCRHYKKLAKGGNK